MAHLLKAAVILATVFVATLADADDCKCVNDVPPKEAEEIWDMLAKKDEEIPYVVPGELASLVPCRNCLEQNRKKRKIEESMTERSREERSPSSFRVWRHANQERNKCPLGYRRFLTKCIQFGA